MINHPIPMVSKTRLLVTKLLRTKGSQIFFLVVGDKNKELQEVAQDQGKMEVEDDLSSDTKCVEDEASFDKITEKGGT